MRKSKFILKVFHLYSNFDSRLLCFITTGRQRCWYNKFMTSSNTGYSSSTIGCWGFYLNFIWIVLWPSLDSHKNIYMPRFAGIYAPILLSFKNEIVTTLHWRQNDHDGVSNHQPHGCLLNRLFGRRSKKTSKLRVTGLCAGNSPGPVNSPHKGPVTRKMFPFDDVIMRWRGFLFVANYDLINIHHGSEMVTL